jgi:type VII secretion protein EccB
MASRQTQLHSHQFALQRLVSAFVTRETDPAQPPFRRTLSALFASVLLAAVALAAVGVYGLVVGGGNTGWRSEHTVIVERESGARYVYLDGRLHPVVNYASALLIAHSASPEVVSVSRSSLAGHPRGTPLGIVGAPDSLPAPHDLLTGAWTLCSAPTRQSDGSVAARSVLVVGERPAGGRVARDNEAVLLDSPDSDDEYLVLAGYRHRVPAADRAVVHNALATSADRTVPAAAFLNALAAGADLAAIPVANQGSPAPGTGMRVGDVVRVTVPGVGVKSYAALADGLAPITQLQVNLLVGAKGSVHDRDQSWLIQQRSSGQRLAGAPGAGGALPEQPPSVVPAAGEQHAACALFSSAERPPQLLLDAGPPADEDAVVTGSRSRAGAVLADRVLVPPGRGAVVESLSAPDAASGTICVITDLGTVYPVAGRDVLEMLGYRGVTPVRVPSVLVSLLPTGRALDPAAARTPAANN